MIIGDVRRNYCICGDPTASCSTQKSGFSNPKFTRDSKKTDVICSVLKCK